MQLFQHARDQQFTSLATRINGKLPIYEVNNFYVVLYKYLGQQCHWRYQQNLEKHM